MKIIFTISWNPLGCYIVDALPKAERFSAGHYFPHSVLLILGLRLEPGRRGGGEAGRRGGHFVLYAEGFRSHNGWAKNSKPCNLAQWVSLRKAIEIIEENPVLCSFYIKITFPDIARMNRWKMRETGHESVDRPTKACKILAHIYERVVNSVDGIVIGNKSRFLCQCLFCRMFTRRWNNMILRKSRLSRCRTSCWLGTASDHIDAPPGDQDATKTISSQTIPWFYSREGAMFPRILVGVFAHMDNANSPTITAEIPDMKLELFLHSPYSPQLSHCYLWLLKDKGTRRRTSHFWWSKGMRAI
jgi:hypothetical protein